MRILFLSDNFPPESNAPASRLHEHAKTWVADGHDVTVITCAPNFPDGQVFEGYKNRWYGRETLDGINVVRVKTYITANEGFVKRSLDYASFGLAAGVAGLFVRRPDVLVVTSPQFFCAVGGWALAALRRVPFVFELRDLWPASIVAVGAMGRGRVVRWLEKLELFLYRRADAIVPVTEAFRADLIGRGVDAGKIHVVRNGADLSWCAARLRDPEMAARYDLGERFVVGYLGTHGMAHALEAPLAAAALLQDRDDVVFVFAGAGAARDGLVKLAEERGLTNVRMIPRQPKAQVPALWSLCDLSLVHLKNDPVFATVIPSKMFEALGNGVPSVVALPEGEATALARDNGWGVIVPPEDPPALAAAIVALADDPGRMAQLRAVALASAPRFSRATQARRMAAVLERIGGAAASRRPLAVESASH